MESCLYEGVIRHRRFAPVANRFSYPLFMAYLDLVELPGVLDRYWLWSSDGWGLARFRRRDHLGDACRPLDECARDLVEQRTGRRPTGPIRLLTHLEYFGYRFNPVSFYYCFEPDGELRTIIAEINNTPWGEQHCYVLDRADSTSPNGLRFRFGKEFHVSPFMGMNVVYDWRFMAPGKALAVHMNNLGADGRIFDATLALRRRAISGGALASALARYPFMTAQVIARIYYQALKLWWKRCPYFPHPRTLTPTEER